MTGRISILKFLISIVLGTLFGGLLLGGVGFLLSGREGFINMGYWGLALGFLGSMSVGFATLISVHFWTGYSERIGAWWFKKISEGDEEQKDY
jgi:hypothetical protein